MASFFGEVVTGSYRFIDPEDPDYNDLRAGRQSWSQSGDIPVEEKLLIVCEGDIASSYGVMLGDSQTVGQLRCEDSSLEVRRGENFTTVLCSGHETGNIGAAVLQLASRENCHVVVLVSRHLSQLRTSQPQTVYSLATKAWAEALPCPALPPPNLLTGLAASVLTAGQLSGHRVALLLSYSEVLTVDSLSLASFSHIHDIGRDGTTCSFSSDQFFSDVVTKCGIKPVKNISEALTKLKLTSCDESLYM